MYLIVCQNPVTVYYNTFLGMECNSYQFRKCIWQPEFKNWMRLFEIHFGLVPLEKA